MIKIQAYLTSVVIFSLFFSILPGGNHLQAQDLVATESLGSGSSVFVFRESRKKRQSRGEVGGRVRLGGGGKGRGSGGRGDATIRSASDKRRAASVAKRKKAAASANKKIAMSNTLTTKAEGFMDGNQIDMAITNYRSALSQNPKNTRATEGLSVALTAKGIDVAGETNNQAATVFFDEAVKLDPDNDVAYAKLGAIYDANGPKEKALVNYEKAVALNPEFAPLHGPLAMAYLEAGEIAKAESSLNKMETAAVDTVETRFLRGLILLKQNKNPESLAAFDRALELDNTFTAAHYYRGQALDRLDKQDQAVEAYKLALVNDPTYAPAHFDLGVAYYNKGDYDNAVIAYQNAIKYDTNNAQAHANLASTYRQQERFADANAQFKLAETGVKDPDMYSEWGYSLGKTNEWDQSIDKLTTAKELSPTAIDDSNLGWGYYNSANSNVAANDKAAADKDLASAKVHLQTAVEKDPKLDAAHLNLGSTHNALGEFEAAVRVLKIATSLRPNWVIAVNQLGLGFRGLNDLASAIATFKTVINLDGQNTLGLFSLGESYNASGNKKEAKKVNDRLKKIDPTLASRLDNVIAGRVIDAAKQKIDQKVPKPPRIPRIPF